MPLPPCPERIKLLKEVLELSLSVSMDTLKLTKEIKEYYKLTWIEMNRHGLTKQIYD